MSDLPDGPRDPDVGSTRKNPSTTEQLERVELSTRAMKLKHMTEQEKMVQEANEITRWDPEREEKKT